MRSAACTEPREHLRQIFGADVEVLADPAPQHGRGHVSVAALLLCLREHVQYHALLAGETVAHVGDLGMAHVRDDIVPL
jgi:hypothetical protein